MSAEANYLEHAGIVTDVKNGRVTISLTGSGCSACHKSLCMLGDSKAKEVEILASTMKLESGDEVIVKINSASGYKAVVFLYLVPFVLMILSLLLMSRFDEGVAGLTSLLILIPYFSLLFALKNKLRSQCNIDVAKR